jgi:predicted ATPase/class 3 adenylate cyclase
VEDLRPDPAGGVGSPTPARPLPTGTVTFLFTDIEGSTRLLQRLGDGYRQIQDRHTDILRRAIATAGGYEVRTEGDAFFAAFDSAAGSVRAAVAAQRELDGQPWPDGVELRVRAGLHTGEGVLGGDDYLGLDVNRAARIAAVAHGGQVLLSGSTHALAEHDLPAGVRLRDVGQHRLKDLAYPEHLYELVIEDLPSDFLPPRSLDARPHNLPIQLTSFVGREREIADVTARLRRTKLLTLSGPGGVGKTRLALQVAGEILLEFADGARFVDLSPVTDPALVPRAIASALAVREESGRPAIDTLGEHLADKELLLVLDNFEQVAQAAGVVGDLRAAAPRCTFLVTSRSPLQLYGEQEVPVEPLSLPGPGRPGGGAAIDGAESVALFADRAALANPGLRLDEAATVIVGEICARLDGLPLAIELAASRVKLLSLEEIHERLGTRLPLLTTAARDQPERQRALRATIDWSYGLLAEPERELLARLSVFAGGATIESADSVANPSGELGLGTLDGLSSLVDKSLVRRSEQAGGSRFGMLETIREYAGERLAEGAGADTVALRHAEYFAGLSERAEPEFVGEEQVAWLDRFGREHENVRAALGWCLRSGQAEPGLRIAAAVWRFWQQRGHLIEGRQWLADLLSLPAAADPTMLRGRAVAAAGSLAYWQNDLPHAQRLYEESLTIARRSGDAVAVFDASFNLSFIPWFRGDIDESWSLLQECLRIAREMEDERRIGEAASGLAYASFMRGDYEAALSLNEEAIALARKTGNRFMLAENVETVGQVHRMLGNHEQSRAAYLEALVLKHEAGNIPGILTTLFMLSSLESSTGHHERAVRLFGAATAMQEEFAASPPALTLDDPRVSARSAIGAEAASRAMDEGRSMDPDAAVRYAGEAEGQG